MKSEFKMAGTLQLTGIRRIDGELVCVCESRGSLCNGQWIFVAVNVDIVYDFSLITFY